MTQILTGLFTLVGTLIVVSAGFWQWRRNQAKDDTKVFQAKRIETLTSVWTALNDIEEAQRQEIVHRAEELSDAHIRHVNLLLMRSSPFLLDDERSWAVEVVQRIVEIDAMMRSLREQGPRGPDWWFASVTQPDESNVVALAATSLREVKEKLASRYAAVTRGDHR